MPKRKAKKRKVPVASSTQSKKQAFLSAYAILGSIIGAAEASGVSRASHFVWMQQKGPAAEQYRADFEAAREESTERMEAEARRRAVDGINEPVIYKGELMGIWVNEVGERVGEGTPGAKFVPLTVKKHSDVLLIFMLKGAMPEKYKDRVSTEFKDLTPPAPIGQVVAECLAALGDKPSTE